MSTLKDWVDESLRVTSGPVSAPIPRQHLARGPSCHLRTLEVARIGRHEVSTNPQTRRDLYGIVTTAKPQCERALEVRGLERNHVPDLRDLDNEEAAERLIEVLG